MGLPAAAADHEVAGREAGHRGGDDLADAFPGHHPADLHRRRVGGAVGEPAAHVRVDRQEQRAGQHLALRQHRQLFLVQREIGGARRAGGATLQHQRMTHAVGRLGHAANSLFTPPRPAARGVR